jgi:hypothetical protein
MTESLTMNYRAEAEALKKEQSLVHALERFDRLVSDDGKSYAVEQWQRFENNALNYFSDIVSNLNNHRFVRKHVFVFEQLILRIRHRQEEGRFTQAERWNDLMNHYEILLKGYVAWLKP